MDDIASPPKDLLDISANSEYDKRMIEEAEFDTEEQQRVLSEEEQNAKNFKFIIRLMTGLFGLVFVLFLLNKYLWTN